MKMDKTSKLNCIKNLPNYQTKNSAGYLCLEVNVFKDKENRTIDRNHNLERCKEKIRELL